MEEMALVYTTWPDAETAEAAARQALTRRLAACANIMGGMRSIYRWEGELRTDEEVAMLLKTRLSLTEALRDLLIALHPYDTPCVVVVALQATGSNIAFFRWLEEETANTEGLTDP